MRKRLCPRDGTVLVARKRHGVSFFLCPGCRGLWISQDSFSRLRVFTSDPARRPGLPATGRFTRRPRIIEGAARCLCAGAPLMEVVEQEGVAVDVCPSCSGIWLDGGEIQDMRSIYRERQISYLDVAFELLQLVGVPLLP